jgi:hypothetical protein
LESTTAGVIQSPSGSDLTLNTVGSNILDFKIAGASAWKIDTFGTLLPTGNATDDLGSSVNYVRNAFAKSVFLQGTAFASLGAVTNGAFKYCSDCTIANPCAGGGTGAMAKGLNGAWACN